MAATRRRAGSDVYPENRVETASRQLVRSADIGSTRDARSAGT
jgi:hypothetical protein